jgi:hypothetical protein
MAGLSMDAEQRILSAVDRVAANVAAGDTPTAALVKAAREYSLTPNFIQLTGRAYNIAQNTCQRHSSDDPLEKSADFDVADAEEAIREIFPAQVKSAAVRQQETVISAEYAAPPSHLYTRHLEAQKRAAVTPWPEIQVSTIPRDESDAYTRAYSRMQVRKTAAEEAGRQLRMLEHELVSKLAGLREYFNQFDALPFQTVARNARTRFGKAAEEVMLELIAQQPQLWKQASDQLHLVDPQAKPYADILACVKLAEEIHTRSQEYAQIQAAMVEKEATEQKPFRPASDSLLEGIEPKQAAFINPVTTMQLANGLSTLRGHMWNAQPISQLDDPVHDRNLQDLKTRTMLHMMMADDPVVKGHDPYAVAAAFNELNQLAPQATMQPAVLTPFLRKRLQQDGLDTFELGELAKLEYGNRGIRSEGGGGSGGGRKPEGQFSDN